MTTSASAKCQTDEKPASEIIAFTSATRSVSVIVMLVVALSCPALAAINPPTDFRTDPFDFFDDGYKLAVFCQFRWTDNATNETGYQFEVSNNGRDFVTFARLPANSGAIDTAYVPWTSNRWFRVRAFNAREVSEYSAVWRVVGNMPPTRLSGSTAATNKMTVNWEPAGSSGLTGYKVQQCTSTNFSGPGLVNYFVPGIGSSTLTITTNFAPNTTYYFRVISTSIGGDSEAMNKPKAYIAVAPNGPPTAPIFRQVWTTADSVNNQSSTSVIFAFEETALNFLDDLVEVSADSNTWTKAAFTRDDQTGQSAKVDNLLPNTLYYFRAFSTNVLGNSPGCYGQIRTPNVAAPGITTWYVSANASGGNNDGTSWANAWQGFKSINWYRLGPGHTVYIDGGANGLTYDHDELVTQVDGASNAPLTFKVSTEPGHNGKVTQIGGITVKSRWLTIDGSKDPGFVVTSTDRILDNINWKVNQTGDEGTFNPAVNTYYSIGCSVRWLECTGVGNRSSGESITAVNLYPETDGPLHSEFAYCWVRDNWGSGIVQGCSRAYLGSSLIKIHHNLVERNRNNMMVISRSVDIYNNILRNSGNPSIAHPDGIQGGVSDVRIYNNIIGNAYGATLYPNLGDGVYANFYVVNNFFYNTQTNVDSSLSLQFSWVGSKDSTLSNVVVAGNTFYSVKGTVLSFGRIRYPVHYRAIKVVNNLFFSGAECNREAAQFGIGGDYTESDVQVDYNIFCGPSKLINYKFKSRDMLYPDAEAFNAATSYKHNKSAVPSVVSMRSNNFVPTAGDRVARGAGVDLSAIADQIPAITNDLNGQARGPRWNIGAYQ
jgi:hypothetical protein